MNEWLRAHMESALISVALGRLRFDMMLSKNSVVLHAAAALASTLYAVAVVWSTLSYCVFTQL